MQIDVQSKPFAMTRALAQFVHRRLRFSLRSRADQITGVTVRLVDINGPKGGADKRCRLRIRLAHMKDVVVEETRQDMYSAIKLAVARAKLTLERRMQRQRDRGMRGLASALPEPVAAS